MENGKYKYEIHCHTKETSNCGTTPAAELVNLYKSKNYDGIVITDHYSQLTFKLHRVFATKYHYDKYLRGYNAAKEAAGEDFTVLLGMEYRGLCSPIDYLIYGMTPDFIRQSGNLLFVYIRRLYKKVKKSGMIVVGAHPFRMGPFRPKINYIDGIEIFNGKESCENNKKAKEWAEQNKDKFITCGSDFHHLKHKNFAAILTDKPITSNEDLLEVLRSGNYELSYPQNN